MIFIAYDAERLFKSGEGRRKGFKDRKTIVEVWDLSDFEMQDVKKTPRVIKYKEYQEKAGKVEIKQMYLVTTLEYADYKVLWKMMHKRWDIEENAFHQLKTYYRADHCYCKNAIQNVF